MTAEQLAARRTLIERRAPIVRARFLLLMQRHERRRIAELAEPEPIEVVEIERPVEPIAEPADGAGGGACSAYRMSIREKIKACLAREPMTTVDLAERLDTTPKRAREVLRRMGAQHDGGNPRRYFAT